MTVHLKKQDLKFHAAQSGEKWPVLLKIRLISKKVRIHQEYLF